MSDEDVRRVQCSPAHFAFACPVTIASCGPDFSPGRHLHVACNRIGITVAERNEKSQVYRSTLVKSGWRTEAAYKQVLCQPFNDRDRGHARVYQHHHRQARYPQSQLEV